jgi:hypothetical protein
MLSVFLLLASYMMTTPKADISFTASTPAGKTVRTFLGIDTRDSIEFIRWRLKIVENSAFELSCSYGMTKPNTNGFAVENKLAMTGTVHMHNGILTLNHNNQKLDLLMLDENILHLLYADGQLMVGNGGWSYTLNSMTPHPLSGISLTPKAINFADSIVLDGRTPCTGMEELMENNTRQECYKKKWRITLYKTGTDTRGGTYKIGTVNARTGKWFTKTHESGRPVYSLDLNNGNTLDLYCADENIVYLMDAKKGLMVGDHDFSYSLNRKDYPGQN